MDFCKISSLLNLAFFVGNGIIKLIIEFFY